MLRLVKMGFFKRRLKTVITLFFILFTSLTNAETLEIPGTGASQLLLRNLARAYEAQNDGVRLVIPHSIGSRGGIRALMQGKTEVARIS